MNGVSGNTQEWVLSRQSKTGSAQVNTDHAGKIRKFRLCLVSRDALSLG